MSNIRFTARHLIVTVLLLASAAAFLFVADAANAQGPGRNPRAPSALAGTGFTYQGQLKSGGALVSGSCDFQFGLWGAASAGTQKGVTQTVTTTVTSGLFTVQLDFGSSAIDGDARYLAITARCPAGSGGFTNLTPRQAVTPAPMALALPGLYTQQDSTSPNLIGGYAGNIVLSNLHGATLGGGGQSGFPNRVLDHYGTVGGGISNTVGLDDGNASLQGHATVGGGNNNNATAGYTTVAGGYVNTASGNIASVGGGSSNTAIGNYSTVAGGINNTASGNNSTVPGGSNAAATHDGEMAVAAGSFAQAGDAQRSVYVMRNETSDATLTDLFLNGSSSRLTIPASRTVTFEILVVGRTSSGTSAGYRFTGVIERQGSATAFVGSPNKVILGEDDSAWDADVVADNGNDALVIQVTGAAATTIRWVATVHTAEVSY